MTKGVGVICASVICLLSAVTFAEPDRGANVILCEGSGSADGKALAQEIESRAVTETVDCAATMEKHQNAVFVAHGISSATKLLSNIMLANEPKVVAGLYNIEYQRLMADYPFVKNVTAVANDPSPVSQLALAKSLFPLKPRLLLLFSAKSLLIRDEYLRQAEALDIEIVAAQVKEEPDALRQITENLDVDAVLAIPDQSIYNKFTLPILLRTSYASNVPLLGFSPQFVRVGALATTYFTTDALAARVVARANQWKVSRLAANATTSDIAAPLIFDRSGVGAAVRVNRNVGKSLSIVVPKTAILEQQINRMRVLDDD